VSRRGSLFAVAAATSAVLSMAWSAVAPAQSPTPSFAIEHDDSLAPGDLQDNFFSLLGSDVALDPDAQREATATTLDALADANDNFTPPTDPDPTDDAGWGWERREIIVPEGDVNGSFTVTIRWGNASIDWDLYIYRERPNGTIDGNPVASSAQGGTTEESATVVPDRVDIPIAPGTYWAYIDAWCTADGDALDVELEENFGEFCAPDPGTEADADDWIGTVEFAPLVLQNRKPIVSLTGPATGTTGQALTFTANATDSDGTIRNYAFDLDGDGRFEYDNGASNVAATTYTTAGVRNVGVRVIDDRGGVTYANVRVEVTGAATDPSGKPQPGVISRFKLNRPVFGGRKGKRLKVQYRLREAATVTVSVYRNGKRIRRIVNAEARTADTTFRFRLRPRGLKRGTYRIHLRAVTASGSVQRAVLVAKRV
jgi:hypothetical protein